MASRSHPAAIMCLSLIVVQNSSLILVTSYSRTLEPAYLPSVAVCLSEVLKLFAAWCLLVYELRSIRRAFQHVSSLVSEHWHVTAQFAVPALCYTLQNNLWCAWLHLSVPPPNPTPLPMPRLTRVPWSSRYYALSNLDPVTAAVTSQMKVITTALASVLMLGRRLSTLQWLSLLLLTLGMVSRPSWVGVHTAGCGHTTGGRPTAGPTRALVTCGVLSSHRQVIMQAPGTGGRPHQQSQSARVVPHNTLSGACAMVLSTVLSAYAGHPSQRPNPPPPSHLPHLPHRPPTLPTTHTADHPYPYCRPPSLPH